MRFSVAEDDAALAGAAAEVLAKEVTADVLRGALPGGDPGPVEAVRRKLADVGVEGTLVPENSGGLGLDENALVPLLLELGRSALPVPAAESIAVGAPLLAAAGSPHLAGVLTGRSLLTAAPDPAGPVPFAARADLVILPDATGLRLHTRAELAVEPVESVDGTRALARVRAPVAGGELLCEGPEALAAARLRGVLGTAALLVGLGERMIATTVDHVGQRHQFGVPVGSFQAVKHALADAALAVRFARPAVLAAGWAQAAGAPDAAARTSMAKVLASEAARLVARTAIQCHGAIGYTTEYDLHLYAKRAWALAAAWGGPADHRDLLARELLLKEA